MKGTIILACLLCLCMQVVRAEGINIIPKPTKLIENGGQFTLRSTTVIVHDSELKEQAELLANALSPATGWDFESSTKKTKNSITLAISNKIKHAEGYHLEVTPKGIVIEGNSPAGVFYGVQSLLQLLPEAVYSKQRQKEMSWTIPAVEITDEPHYPWRGMMLDVARYFFEKDFVLEYIDMMAMYKMNQLHLHFIDDSGWRMEIPEYPKLTEIGAWSGEGEQRHGGFYTKEELKEIVAYAEARNVNIIPEIEIPAHVLSAIASYPWLSCTEKQHTVPEKHFISRDIYCVGKESTFEFLDVVFKNVAEIFPSNYIHVGGDEASYDRWTKCPHCQKRQKELGLKNTGDLQVYFTNRVQKMLKAYGKTIVGWDEIIERGIEEKAVGMIWHKPEKAILATKEGHDVVMSLTGHAYFDFPESKTPGEIQAANWCPPISLQQSYEWDPMIEGIDEQYQSHVLGVNACLWSDQFIHHGGGLQEISLLNEDRSEKYIQYLTLPRMSAAAEVGWTPQKQRDYTEYQNRMASHYTRYNFLEYGFRVPEPKLVSKKEVTNGFEIEVASIVEGAEIRYTTNGVRPNSHSPLYTKPVTVAELSDFNAITVLNRKQYSLPLYFPNKLDKYKSFGKMITEWKPSTIQGKTFGDLSMDATGKINKNGNYTVTFKYTKGTHRLDIKGIEVFKNGTKVAEDFHEGYTGGAENNNSYTVPIDCYETGAAFTIKAKVRGDIGNDSYGYVFIK